MYFIEKLLDGLSDTCYRFLVSAMSLIVVYLFIQYFPKLAPYLLP